MTAYNWLHFVLVAMLGACVTSKAPQTSARENTYVPLGTPATFEFDSLDARPVSSRAMRGRPSVLAFITTWDLTSQAQVSYLVAMAKNDGDRTNYAIVALQERKDRELVEVYQSGLRIPFPVATADRGILVGGSTLGDIQDVPTVIVLDKTGRTAFRRSGLVKSEEIRDILRRL